MKRAKNTNAPYCIRIARKSYPIKSINIGMRAWSEMIKKGYCNEVILYLLE